MRTRRLLAPLLLAPLLLAACSDDEDPAPTTATAPATDDTAAPSTTTAAPFTVTAEDFADGETIPLIHACQPAGGANAEVVLSWSGVPEGTTSLALLMDDPDAPLPEPFVHWVVVDIDPAAGATDPVGDEGIQGLPTAGPAGYFGPCPPAGDPHTYRFRLFALEEAPAWADEPTGADVEAAAEGALAVAQVTGTFDRDG